MGWVAQQGVRRQGCATLCGVQGLPPDTSNPNQTKPNHSTLTHRTPPRPAPNCAPNRQPNRQLQVVVPRTYAEFTSRRVLTTQWLEGEKLSQSHADDVGRLVNVGVICYLKQVGRGGAAGGAGRRAGRWPGA